MPHNLLLLKLQLHGITGPLLLWMQSYLSERKQRVVLEGASSDWLPVTSGVPQGSILGSLLFLVYVNDVPSCIINNSNIALFADDSKLYRAMDINYDHNLLQADLDCLHTWSLSSGLDFNARKCIAYFKEKVNRLSVCLHLSTLGLLYLTIYPGQIILRKLLLKLTGPLG